MLLVFLMVFFIKWMLFCIFLLFSIFLLFKVFVVVNWLVRYFSIILDFLFGDSLLYGINLLEFFFCCLDFGRLIIVNLVFLG